MANLRNLRHENKCNKERAAGRRDDYSGAVWQ